MNAVAQLPCVVIIKEWHSDRPCDGYPVHVHHAKTGAGGRKNHMLVLPLCYNHHQGKEGIHTMGRKPWQEKFGTEDELLDRVQKQLDYAAWM